MLTINKSLEIIIQMLFPNTNTNVCVKKNMLHVAISKADAILVDWIHRGVFHVKYFQTKKTYLGCLVLTLWGRLTHIWVNKLTIIGSDNGLSPGRRQAIIWTNSDLLSIGP